MNKTKKTKRKLPTCDRKQRSFIVAQLGSDRLGAAAGRTREEAIEGVMADRGDVVKLFMVCAKDAGEARIFHAMNRSVALKK